MTLKRLAIVGITLAALVESAAARRLVRVPSVDRIKQVQVAVVGRVVGLLANDITVDGAKFRVAVVRVNERIKGLKKATTIRVGYNPQANQGNIAVPLRPGIVRPVSLTVGDLGLFLLNKHPKADFYTVPTQYDFVTSSMPGYAAKVMQTKMMMKIGKDLKKSLNAKDPNERYTAAALLIQQYRTPKGRAPYKQVPISAEESKLILTGLSKGDWSQPRTAYNQLHPWNMFNRLGLSTNDGWRPPPGAQRIEDYYTAAQVWLTANAGKYRIKKYASK